MGLDLLIKAAKRSGTHLLNSSPPIKTLVWTNSYLKWLSLTRSKNWHCCPRNWPTCSWICIDSSFSDQLFTTETKTKSCQAVLAFCFITPPLLFILCLTHLFAISILSPCLGYILNNFHHFYIYKAISQHCQILNFCVRAVKMFNCARPRCHRH